MPGYNLFNIQPEKCTEQVSTRRVRIKLKTNIGKFNDPGHELAGKY